MGPMSSLVSHFYVYHYLLDVRRDISLDSFTKCYGY
jgi:hypothetical protein